MDYKRRDMKSFWNEWKDGIYIISSIVFLVFVIFYFKSIVPQQYLGVITNISVVSSGHSSFMGENQSIIYSITLDHKNDIIVDSTKKFGGKGFCSSQYPLATGYELWDSGTCYKIQEAEDGI